MHGERRVRVLAVAGALAATALAGCTSPKLRESGLLDRPPPVSTHEKLRQSGLIDDSPRVSTHEKLRDSGLVDDSPAKPVPLRYTPCEVPPLPRDPCLGPLPSQSCTPVCEPIETNRCGLVGVDEYVPMIPVANTRAAMTTLVLAPSPWSLSSGDPTTPERGRATFRWERISDERVLADLDGNVWTSDGEVQAVSLEYMSPKISFNPSRCSKPFCFHLGASLHAFTLTEALFDGLRNFIEEDVIGSDDSVQDSHDLGGRELSLNGDDLLDSTLWKARGTIKIPLPDLPVDTTRLQGSFSVGITSPAFGDSRDSGNSDVQVDATLAFALPLSRYFRFVGGGSVLFPGSAPAYDDVDLDVETVVGTARLGLEWWPTRRFGAMIGYSYYGKYTKHSGLPTDGDSSYIDVGFLWRIDQHWDVHLYGAENPQSKILNVPGSDFSNSQRDADFTIGLGVGWTF